MFVRIMSSMLVVFIVFMGLKQGWAMISAKPEMTQMLKRFQFSRQAIVALGLLTCISALLILFRPTFLTGNFLMAATILLIMCCQLSLHDIKGAAIELPFLMMNLVAVFLHYPFTKVN